MLVDTITNWRNYGFGPVWEDVMTWLETAFRTGNPTGRNPHGAYAPAGSPALEDGVHALGEARVTVTSRVTRLRSEARYETHRQLCDVHLVLAGREGFLYTPEANLTPDGDFDETTDTGFLQPCAPEPVEAARLILTPGMFVLVFPGEAHVPALAIGENAEPLRKCIAKLPFSSLRV